LAESLLVHGSKMQKPGSSTGGGRQREMTGAGLAQMSPEHYIRLLLHRKWLILATFVVVSGVTAVVSFQLPDVYTSETVILVDPQKVPESYVRATVTGDIRSRLGTLSQQILSAKRLQTIIEKYKLYPKESRTMAREDLLAKMRKDISVSMVGAGQDLQAFKISYTGSVPRTVAEVTNELAGNFIDENLKIRELQAMGTTEFLENQLQESKKNLEEQETKVRDFRLKHLGEMPEQQTADLQILGQLQSQLQLAGEALARAEQQKGLLQSMSGQSNSPVVEIDAPENRSVEGGEPKTTQRNPAVPAPSMRAKLAAALSEKLERGYTENHPDIKKLRAQIADEDAKTTKQSPVAAVAEVKPVPPAYVPRVPAAVETKRAIPPVSTFNPVLQSNLKAIDEEIAKHKQEQLRLNKQIAIYQSKLEAIPVREQEIASLVRDHEMSKAHYGQLLDKQLSAQTATQLEFRQKGEKFSILDSAQPAERPSKPNRMLINSAGAAGGLGLGFLLALITEFLGMSITVPEQITSATGIPVLEVIPIIMTVDDRRRRKRMLILATVSGTVMTVLISGVILLYRFRTQLF
jgi:polysaccharide chain length determinant protein (PEP-CTERM system associated)